MKTLLSTLLFLIVASQANAFELFPEYRSIRPNDPVELDKFKYIDSEYDSDYFAFLNTPESEQTFNEAKNGVFGTVGSLGSKEFLNRNAVKLSQGLSDELRFKFLSFRDGHFDGDYQASFFEFEYRKPSSKIGFSVYGEVLRDKKEDDFGYSVQFFGKSFQTRLFVIHPDFSRNERNRNTDSFNVGPIVYGAKLTRQKDLGFDEIVVRYEDKLEWDFPDLDKRYIYSQSYFSYYWMRPGGKYNRKEFRLEVTRKGEEQKGIQPASSTAQINQEIHLVRSMFSLTKDRSAYGLFYTFRDWNTVNKEGFSMSVAQPFYWWSYFKNDSRTSKVGISASAVDVGGSNQPEFSAESRADGRLNWGWEFHLKKGGSLTILLAFDLDRFGQSDTWEGGNVQYSFLDF